MNTIIRAVAAISAVIGAQAANAANAYDTQLRDMFATIIGTPTSVGLGQVPKMAEYLAGKLRDAGFPAEDIHILPLGETASLVVRYRGDGTGGKPIDFMAHMDVVTARREDWQRDPYTLIEENGYFYGRGTIDIKQEVAELTEAFIRLKTEGFKPTRDLVIVFTGDEETEEATTADLVTNHRDLIDAEYALNGDGGDGILDEKTGKAVAYYVQGAEKTYADMELTTHNRGGHSSRPRPDNAIYDLADAIKRIQAYRFPVMWNEWTLGNFRAAAKVTPGPVGLAMGRFAANPHDRAAAEVLYNNFSYIGKTRTTCVPTLLTGGHADNALPQMAQVTLSCRIFPGMSIEQVQARLQRLVGDKVEVHAVNAGVVSAASPMNAALMQAIATQVHAIYPGIPIVPEQASYSTDGAVFRHAGIPTYGTQASFYKESEDFAHGLNECLPVASLYEGEALWYGLMRELAGPH
jgi:acetylornithine deacetylase/succinyl-diaminopimelate desuccinylase-like protein